MSLEEKCQQVFIELFEAYSTLDAVSKHHASGDDDLELPNIVIKATITNQPVSHSYKWQMRMYEVELECTLTALIGQTSSGSVDDYWRTVLTAINGARFTNISALKDFTHFTITDDIKTEHAVEDDRVIKTITLRLMVQEVG